MIFFTSDFGHADPFVGIVEAVIASIAPHVRVVHLAHDVAAQDVGAAALGIWAAVPYLPDGAIVLGVVDPGVGSARRPIAARGRLTYVGPDNGLFAPAWRRDPPRAVHLLESPAHRLGESSRTFDGRDVFGPAAAHLARDVPIEALGPAIDPASLVPSAFAPTRGPVGTIWSFDRYGNAITTLEATESTKAIVLDGVALQVQTHFADTTVGAPVAYVGSTGLIEIAIRNGSARETMQLEVGEPVERIAGALAP